jgi:hypothetical protein
VVELFLHARKLGLLTMEWQYVCPGCGEIVERLASLTSATAHYFCQICNADRDADLSDFIEVTFSISPEVRRSRYHDPWSLTPEEHLFFLTSPCIWSSSYEGPPRADSPSGAVAELCPALTDWSTSAVGSSSHGPPSRQRAA